jgi:serine/threonine-protein kinase
MITRVGRYRVTSLLGVGGLGPLYKARDEQVGRTVALRVVDPAIPADPVLRQAVIDAAERVAALNDPSLAMLFDALSEDDADALAFEYVDGKPTQPRSEGGVPDLHYALDIVSAVARALAHAHALEITHGDVRPHNILVSARGRPKLVETGFTAFSRGGAARRALARHPDRVPAEAFAVAPYVSPEEAVGQSPSPAGDVFSLGVVFFELLTGTLPFVTSSVTDLLIRAASEDPPSPRSRNPSVSPSLDALVLGCLARSPRSRLTAQVVATRAAALLGALREA